MAGTDEMRSFDLVVIGAGVAGLTAASVAARHGLSVVVVERTGAGGQVMTVDRIDYFPGLPAETAGYELGPLLQEQAEEAGAEFVMGSVLSISPNGSGHLVDLGDEMLGASTVIVAAGSSRRVLGVPGEVALQGRGVSHCASCDGPLMRGMSVCVVGGGDAALDEALVLAEHASKVTVIHRGQTLRAQQHLIDEVVTTANIEVLANTVVEEIMGPDVVTGLTVGMAAGGERWIRQADGIFVNIGLEPNTAFVRGLLALDETGRIEVDAQMCTSVAGIFAAGDIRGESEAYLAASAGDGATAARAAWRHVRQLKAG